MNKISSKSPTRQRRRVVRRQRLRVPESTVGPGACLSELFGTMDDDNIGSLWRMVQDLKEMDAAWRESVDGPTPAEQSLYALILVHVFSEIFLFHREKYSKLHDTCEDEVEWLVKELKDRGSGFGPTLTDGNLNINGKEEDENLRDILLNTNAKLFSSWNYVILLADNLIDLRRSLCEVAPGKADANNVVETQEKPLGEILPGLTAGRRSYSPTVGKEVECYREIRKRVTSNICFIKAKAELLGRWRCLETREKALRNILHGLAARRSERSYAPPVGKELECYREIRKWVTSNIFFFKAKGLFVGGSRGFRGGNNFASERNQLWSNWKYTLSMFPTSDFQSSGPNGYKFTLIFEELSDFQSLLSIWKRRFSDITIAIARYSQEESMDVSVGTDSLDIKVDELKTVEVRQELEVEKKLRHDLYVIDACKSVISNNRPAKKTRYEYLMDIFSAFESMGYSSHSLDIVEFRMYTRILEHLQSYKWLAYAEAKPVEKDLFYELRSDEEEESVISESDTWTREKKSREQYLQEIVSTVDAIESEYFLLRPSLKEWLLYDKIERRVTMDIRQSSCHLKREEEGKTGSVEEVALARRMLKAILTREVELASGLEKEIGDTLGLIFTRCMPTETKLTKWLVEHMEDAESEMKALATKDSRGFKLFDSALLSLLEIRELYGKFLRKFYYTNWVTYGSLNTYKLFQVPLVEGLTSLPWLEETSP